jgi:magnesium chelatase subunit D
MNPDALAAAALVAVDPAGLGGLVLRAPHGPDREAWLQRLQALMPPGTPLRRMPAQADDAAVLGGLDLPATLQAGRPVVQPGLLPQADGGMVILTMAERLPAAMAARLAAALDTGEVQVQRDGLDARQPARVGLVALDEGIDDDEGLPGALRERLAFWLDAHALRGLAHDLQAFAEAGAIGRAAEDGEARAVKAARERLARVEVPAEILEALCAAGLALGVDSLRAAQLALRAACASAAWDGREAVTTEDAALAVRLVLAHRATRLPAPPEATDEATPETPPADAPPPPPAEAQARDAGAPPEAPHPPAEPPEATEGSDPPASPEPAHADALAEQLVQAAKAAIPPGLLALLSLGDRRARGASGRAGAMQQGGQRGRPVGARRGPPRGGARLHLLDTLRAAAPWQTLRARTAPVPRPVHVRREDFHVRRFRQNTATTAIFVVDASGSSALHRLSEAKGAVELLLADCYVRRDRVALLGFRGRQADLLLPPTRSLARAKRSLAALPGGGGTPLASALDAARGLAESVRRSGDTPLLVLMTDGRANIARDGSPGRARAGDDALAAAGALRSLGVGGLLVDTSPQPQAVARELAQRMGATYVPLPYADARAVSQAVRVASGRG